MAAESLIFEFATQRSDFKWNEQKCKQINDYLSMYQSSEEYKRLYSIYEKYKGELPNLHISVYNRFWIGITALSLSFSLFYNIMSILNPDIEKGNPARALYWGLCVYWRSTPTIDSVIMNNDFTNMPF